MAHYRNKPAPTAASCFTPGVLSIVTGRLRESDGPIGRVARVHTEGMTASELMRIEGWNNGLAYRYLKAYEAAVGTHQPSDDRVTPIAVSGLAGLLDTKLHWRARRQVQARIKHLQDTRPVLVSRGAPPLDFERLLELLATGAELVGLYAHRDGGIRVSKPESLADRKVGRSLDLRSRLQTTDRSGSSSRRHPIKFERILLAPEDRRTVPFNKADEVQLKVGLSNNEARTHAEREGNRQSVPGRRRKRVPGTGTEIFRVTLNEIDFVADCMQYRIVKVPTDASSQRRLRDAARAGERAAHALDGIRHTGSIPIREPVGSRL